MPAPYCAVCGSVDVVVNESGLFVCNDCGSRFTIEAMRNLMGAQVEQRADASAPAELPAIKQGFLYGSAEADLVISHYEHEAYDLAAEAYKQMANKEGVHPWVIFIGSLSDEFTDLDKPFYGTAMKNLHRRCQSYGLSPAEEGELCLKAMLASMNMGSTIGSLQVKQLNSMIAAGGSYLRSEILDVQIAAEQSLSNIRRCIRVGIIQLYYCVKRGFVPSVEDWKGLQIVLKDLPATLRTPLFERMVSRIASCVSSQQALPEAPELKSEISEHSLLELARSAWDEKDYETAHSCYERLKKSEDVSYAIEAGLATCLIENISDDIYIHLSLHMEWMERGFNEACEKAAQMDADAGLLLMKYLVSKLSIIRYIGIHYTAVLRSSRDADIAEECKERRNNYLGLINNCSLNYPVYLVALFYKANDVFDFNTIVFWKHALLVVSKDARAEAWHQAFSILKGAYVSQLKTGEDFIQKRSSEQSRLANRIEELAKLIREKQQAYDSLGIFAVSKKDKAREEIQSLQEELQSLRDKESVLDETLIDEYWGSL